jgi:creatinine amidohydrolase/Fe(II)-dependent formamide hydrolase-like protein
VTRTIIGGDPPAATADMGRTFIDYKVNDAVEQIRKLLAER